MMPSLWFVVPAHGRLRLTEVCLRQLRRTCDSLSENGVEASAVVIADDANLDVADELGFATCQQENRFLGRKFNDGIQLALDTRYNPRPADYVVPCGSDDWVDWRLFLDLPADDQVFGFQHISFVREDGRQITDRLLQYPGGCGIRIYPRALLRPLGSRPCDEFRKRGCDTSILNTVRIQFERTFRRNLPIFHVPSDPRQIVDWKSPDMQLNDYDTIVRWHRRGTVDDDPFEVLRGVFPPEALDEMAAHYESVAVPA